MVHTPEHGAKGGQVTIAMCANTAPAVSEWEWISGNTEGFHELRPKGNIFWSPERQRQILTRNKTPGKFSTPPAYAGSGLSERCPPRGTPFVQVSNP